MATTNAGVQSLSTAKTVDASLWWDPFSSLLTELESSALSSQSLAKKLKDNHAWFLSSVSQFKQPNQKSREALDSPGVKIGSHELNIHPTLKGIACKISAIMCLDEVQSYILVTRSAEHNDLVFGDMDHDILNPVILEYYTERQCLLKCIRQIFMHALYSGSQYGGSAVMEEAQMLISDDLESKLLSNLLDLVSSNFIEHMDVDLYTLWAEEILIEDNLILDILLLVYNESFGVCDAKSWKKLCALYEEIVTGLCNFPKLAISPQATCAIYHAKMQLLLILIEALNLVSLLQMIHDNIPFRQGQIAFSEMDITEIDTIISSLNAIEVKELGPIILAWAVFICLISSLPKKEETNMLTEINHIGYVRQAFEASSLRYFLEILQSDALKDPEGPLASYRSVIRTFISAFIASYEISLQFEDDNFKSILDILCNIYRGEELLSIQFWDRDSFIDGPIRCLLCNLEGEFPYRSVELVRLLSALCEGAWPSECVFNFLNKSVGLSTPMAISNGLDVDSVSKVVETQFPLHVTGVEGLVIPSKSRGHVLRMIDKNVALVRWEYTESGVLVLLLRLAQELYTKNFEEAHAILDLLSRLTTFNMGVCCALLDAGKSFVNDVTILRNQEKCLRIDVVEIACFLVKSLSPCKNSAVTMSLGINILTKMLKCLPSRVANMVLKANIFDVDVVSNSSSSRSWLLSGRLAKLLLIDCEQIDCSLSLSVLDFTMKLLDTGLENDIVLALIVFCIQYVFVNLESWTFKVKHTRWKVTVKVLEVMKKSIQAFSCYKKLGDIITDILLGDSSVHTVLFRIVCRTSESLEKLYLSRSFDIVDIEGLQLSISVGLDVLISLVSTFAKDPPSFPVFHHAILSPVTKPILVITAATSLISYFGDPKIQMQAARLLSVLFTADFSQSLTYSNASLGLDNKQLSSFRKSMVVILCEQLSLDDDLIVAALKLLTSAVLNQPAFLTAVIISEEIPNDKPQTAESEHQLNKTENGSLGSTDKSLLDSILHLVGNSEDLLKRKPNILLSLMKFLRALWQDAPQFTKILEELKLSDKFWRLLTSPVILISCNQDKVSEKLTEEELQCQAYRYQYLSYVLDIMGNEIFLQKRLLHGELVVNGFPKSETNGSKRKEDSEITRQRSFNSLKEIISTWCESSLLSDLIKACVFSEYDNKIHWHAKVAAALSVVRVMIKLKSGDSGSLSVSFIERIAILAQKLRKLPAFSDLATLYAERGYSEEQELDYLILNDLFYHIKGEIEGRHIDNRLFKELLQFLLESEFLNNYRDKKDDDILADNNGIYLYDSGRLRADLGIEIWDPLAWIETKEVAETALLCWERVNLMIMNSHSKLSALRGIISLFYMHEGNFTKVENFTQLKISKELVLSSINHICQCLYAMLESLTDVPDTDEDGLDILTAQAELLLLITRYLSNDFSRSAFVVIIKTSGYGLKLLCSYRQSVGVITAKKVFLMLILSSVELNFKDLDSGPAEVSPEASYASLGLLPVLCDCIEHMDCCTLSLTAIGFILGSFSMPATWFPIIQKHFPLQHIVKKLRDITSSKLVSVILKFLLNFARVREGAEMLLNAGVLASLKILLSVCSGGVPFLVERDTSFSNIANKTEIPQPIWGLSLAVLAAIIQSLENSTSTNIVDYVLSSILVDKTPLILLYLSAPDFQFEGHEKKKARALKSTISLHELEETQNTMTLICVLARHWNSWNKALRNIESRLREKIIHFLAFISRATQRPGESPRRDSPLLCHPVLKEEFEWCKEPSFINSSNGWFALSALGCELNHKFSALSSRTAIVIGDQSIGKANITHQTHFSDLIAIGIYKIAFLLLKFLCIQTESASTMAAEVGFVDLAHFPELPMPDILHGLQDQGISIVTELCAASKTKLLTPEIQDTCRLMLQITVMALHLEYCVIQICGIRPVLGYVETFSKELQLLIRATEGHLFLKEPLKDLKQIASFVYPDLEASY